jgi:hypothetical protein
MNTSLENKGTTSSETAKAWFWQERKWHWILDAAVFAALGFACTWPMIAAGGAIATLCQRLGA